VAEERQGGNWLMHGPEVDWGKSLFYQGEKGKKGWSPFWKKKKKQKKKNKKQRKKERKRAPHLGE